MSDIIAERVLELREGETSRPVTVRVYRPERHPDERVEAWTCKVEWDGLRVTASSFGLDSAEALFNALDMVGAEIKQHDGLRIPRDDYPEGQKRNPWPIEAGPPSLPIAEPLPGDLILERWLTPPGADKPTARVTVHRPEPKGADYWHCWYEIDVPGQPLRRRRNVGTDSAQALFHALIRIKWDVDTRGLTLPNMDDPWEIKDPLDRAPEFDSA